MNIPLFFDAVPESLVDQQLPFHCLRHSLVINTNGELNLEDIQIALVFIPSEIDGHQIADTEFIRTELYKLSKPKGLIRVADLGDLRAASTAEETAERLQEVLFYLYENNIKVLLVGKNHALDLAQFKAYTHTNKLVNVTTFDALFDIELEFEDSNRSHTYNILTYPEHIMELYAHFGYQNFMANADALNIFEKLNFFGKRIGELRNNIHLCEPEIRNSDMISFDLSVLRFSESPGSEFQSPFGLNSEEACQISWFAGMSNRNSSFGIYGYNYENDTHSQTAKIAATMLWHYIAAHYTESESAYFESPEYDKYIVTFEHAPYEMIFYKGRRSGKWWLRLDNSTGHDVTKVTPCNYEDYQMALQNEIPERYLRLQD